MQGSQAQTVRFDTDEPRKKEPENPADLICLPHPEISLAGRWKTPICGIIRPASPSQGRGKKSLLIVVTPLSGFRLPSRSRFDGGRGALHPEHS